jgi:uncharacterized membrane protein
MSVLPDRRLGLILGSVLVAASFVLAAALYQRLPDPVPTHWSLRGDPNGFTAKPLGAFVVPLVMAGIHLALLFLRRLSPSRSEGVTSDRVLDIVHVAILGFVFIATAAALLAAAGAPVPVARILPAAVGLMLAIVGNYLGKVRRNFFIGIRTPWTLLSDEVWLRTHRLGGKVFVVGGLALCLAALVDAGSVALLVILGAMVLVPTIYSYVIYRSTTTTTTGSKAP